MMGNAFQFVKRCSAARVRNSKGKVMPDIVVTDQQARLISEACVPVQVRDASGRILGVISRAPYRDDSDEIEEMKRRMKRSHRSYFTEEVLKHLRSLEANSQEDRKVAIVGVCRVA
jgi:hypothetical protein